MAARKALVTSSGRTQQILDADTLAVGAGIDAAAAGALAVGGTTATSITLGSATIPVSIPGNVGSDINFGGAPGTYKITNLANGTNPNDAVNLSQLSSLVAGVSSKADAAEARADAAEARLAALEAAVASLQGNS
jgi:hypothetical protein